MRFLLGRNVAGLIAAMLLLVGCEGSKGQSAGVTALPSVAKQSQAMRYSQFPEKSSQGLIYAASGCGGTCVFSYPKGKLVGTVSQFGDGICSDSSGNIFITYQNSVTEYAHGGTSPIATLSLPGNNADGCAIDSATGNLAVVFRTTGADIAVFPDAQGTPTLYSSQVNSRYCGYDNKGNLFVNGYDGQNPGFSELLNGHDLFTKLTIDSFVGNPGQVQWDGEQMTWQSVSKGQVKVSQLAISGSEVTVAGTTTFSGIGKVAAPSWIFGDRIAIPYANKGTRAKKIGIWRYPQGGKAVKNIKGPNQHSNNLQGVAFSANP